MAQANASDPVGVTWAEQKRWSAAADRLKSEYGTWRWWVFSLTLAGAALATASSQAPEGFQRWLAGASAIVLAAAPFLSKTKLSPERLRDWVRARAVSEALKTETYLCQTRSGEYAEGNAPAKLVEKRQELLKDGEDLVQYTADVPEAEVDPPPPMSIDQYIADRIAGQILWYRRKAGVNRRLGNRFRMLEFVLGLLAAALGALSGLVSELAISAWVAVITTLIGALTAHAAAGRYDYLVTSYMTTATRLESLRDGWSVLPAEKKSAEAGSQFVQDCEAAISVENQGWMAKWAKSDKTE